jgi:hypothetical protein
VSADVPSLSGSSGSADFRCDPLPLVSLTGRIEPSDLLAGKQYDGWIRLLGRWTERDVMFFDIPLGIVTPDSGGVFSMQFTDFSSDPLASLTGQTGVAINLVAKASDGRDYRDLASLRPERDGDDRLLGMPALRVMPNYGGEVTFTALPNQ